VERARAPDRDRGSFDRVLAWSLGGSILVHILLVLLSPLFIQTDSPPGGAPAAGSEATRAFGLEMIVAIPSETAPEPPDLPAVETAPTQTPPTAQPPAAARPGPQTPPGQPGAPGADATTPVPVRPRSATEALQPGTRDPRLYVPPRPLPPPDQRTEHERYMEHLQARIDAVNDSMGIEANRNRRTADWTITDGSGNTWGLSPSGLHLGGVTIPRELLPLPGATGDNQSIEADRERQRQRDEIQRQGEASDRRATQDERIEATREEQDRRRANGGS
jgi:hypothetical protein